MRKALYGICCLLLAAGTGCALTDYADITDSEAGNQNFFVNTNGKAHIIESVQTAVLLPGEWVSHTWFVDQNLNGNRTITTVFASTSSPNPTDVFHDDFYCNPDWNGCAAWTANDPPGGSGSCAFDGKGNPNCTGFGALYYLTCYYARYYGECGRAGLSVADKIQLLNMGRLGNSLGMEGLFYDLNAKNLTIVLDNNSGVQATIPVRGTASLFAGLNSRKGWADLTNPLVASTARSWADFTSKYGTNHMTVTVTYNGVGRSFQIAPVQGPSKLLSGINKYY